MLAANELQNVLPSSAVPGGMSPHEAWWGEKPDVGMYRTFGCEAMVLTPAADRGSKAAPVSRKMIHIRHDMAAKGYRFYDPVSKRVVISRDCWFMEMNPGGAPERSTGGTPTVQVGSEEPEEDDEGQGDSTDPGGLEDLAEEAEEDLPPLGQPYVQVPVREEPAGPPEGNPPGGVPVVHPGPAEGEEGQGRPGEQVQEAHEPAPAYQPYVLALPHREPRSEQPSNYSPPHTRSHGPPQGGHSNSYSPPHTRSRTRRERAQQAKSEAKAQGPLPSTMRIPQSYKEARESPESAEWAAAEREEIASMLENEVWGEPVDLPPGATVVSSKWVYDIKYKGTGEVERLKARFVGRGCSQIEGKDYHADNIHAPTVRTETVKVVTHVGARNGWYFRLLDVKCAYLAAPVKERVYIRQPQGYEDPRNPTGVLLLKKAIYGLKQSARAWYGRLSEVLIAQGFEINAVDPSLFQRRRGDTVILVQVYVDDLGVVSNSEQEIDAFQEAMESEFRMKDLGETTYYLGVHFDHDKDNRTVHLHQNLYIQHTLDRFQMQGAKTAATPLEEGHTLTLEEPWKPGEEEEMRGVPYAELLGCLNYLSTCTRPDISYAVSLLSRYSREGKHHRKHWDAAKRVLRYLKGTPRVGITLGGTAPVELRAYSDASLGDDLSDRRSTLAYCTTLGSGPISWKSTRSKPVATSTAESEYYAASAGGKEVVYLRQLLASLGYTQTGPTPFSCDNQAAIAIAKNPEHHSRTKHIDICYHWIRDAVKRGVLQLQYLPSEENPADLLTKALGRKQHEYLLGILQVQDSPGVGTTS